MGINHINTEVNSKHEWGKTMKGKTKIGLILVAIMVTVVLNSGCIMNPPPNESLS